jgi:hypothetical protein
MFALTAGQWEKGKLEQNRENSTYVEAKVSGYLPPL